MNKQLPPFGKKLQILLTGGDKPNNNVFVFIGDNSWSKAKAFEISHFVLVLPLEKDPSTLIWPVRGCNPLIVSTSFVENETDIIRKLAYCLFVHDATKVHALPFNGRLIVYRRGGK